MSSMSALLFAAVTPCCFCRCRVVVVVVVVIVVCMTLAVWRHKIDGVHNKAFCRTAVHVPGLLNQVTNVGGE